MYELYKKVFNNIILKNQIYRYVRYEEIINNNNNKEFDYKYYNHIKNSFRYFDITINKLLSNNLYSLFDDYFQINFKILIKNEEEEEEEHEHKLSKYWYINKFNLNEIGSLINLIQYKEFGFNKFKLVYKYFKQEFYKKDQQLILIAASTSGNYEIYSFLKNEFINNAISNPHLELSNYNLEIELPNGKKAKVFDSGGNMDIFIDFFNHYKSYFQSSPFGVAFLIIWLIENKQTEQCIVVIKEFKEMNHIFHNLKFELVLIGLSLSHSDLKLAKFLIEEMNILKIFNNATSSGENIKRAYIYKALTYARAYSELKEIDYQVFNYYWNQYDNEIKLNLYDSIIKFLNGPEIKLLNFTFQSCNFDNEIIKNELIKGYYEPTFKEFQYLVENLNENNTDPTKSLLGIGGFNLLYRISILITNKLFDLEYLKLFLETISSILSPFKQFKLPGECIDTKFEIVEFIFKNFKQYSPNSIYDDYKNENSFFNDIRTAQYYLNSVPDILGIDQQLLQQQSKLFNLENGILSSSIKNNHFEMVEFLIKNKKGGNIESNLEWDKLIDFQNHDSFKIYKFLNSYKKSNNYQDNSIRDNYLNQILKIQDSKFFHYNLSAMGFIYLNNFNQNYKFLLPNFKNPDLMLIKFLIKENRNAFKILFQNVSIENIFINSKLSILEYSIQNNLKLSNFYHRNTSIIITNLFTSNRNRLLYFIENDENLVFCNFKLFKNLIIRFKDSIILNSILNSNSNHHLFKLKLLISLLITVLSNGIGKNDKNQFWYFNINYKNKLLEKSDIEPFKNWPSNKRLSSINYYYNNYLKSNQSILFKENSNLIFLIQSFLELYNNTNNNNNKIKQ